MASDSAMDVREIFARLPHRQPLLMVDRVLEVIPCERLVAVKNVTINEEFFRGHFPGNPIMPGVLIVEALAQAAGLLVTCSIDAAIGEILPYLAAVEAVKFRRPVVPGDQLTLEVELKSRHRTFWKFRGIALVDGQRTTEAEILLSIHERAGEGK